MKILALQFKYFGDAVLLTPALRALREQFPQAELHLLVPKETAPLFQHLPWLTRVWAMPRRRGQASLRETWPLIRALRREHFDRSVDFASNDRGAILSLLIGAPNRLGRENAGGFLGRKYCYHIRVPEKAALQYEAAQLAGILSGWQVPAPASLALEIRSDPTLASQAEKILPKSAILCHMASSQTNRQWPVKYWAELSRLAATAGISMAFTTAIGEREQALARELKEIAPQACILPPLPQLDLFLAVLQRAKGFISGDTGPLHFAAGLGVPTISLFGPSQPGRFAPVGKKHISLKASDCPCGPAQSRCQNTSFCLETISAYSVFTALSNSGWLR